jgi:DNA-binding beta-propeller fold protein YncE
MFRGYLSTTAIAAIVGHGSRRRMLAGLALCVAALIAPSAGVAQAEPPKLIPYGTFPAELPLGVAVDQPSGDVFVAGISNEAGTPIEKFDATGSLISPPPPFGTNFEGSEAVDPATGDLYVFNLFGSIQTFDPTSGEMVGSPFSVSVSGGLFERFLQIAADGSGNVYVPDPSENAVLEYSPTGTLLKTFTGGGGDGALKGPSGVAVDSSGNLWVADTGNNRIEELDPADAPIVAHQINRRRVRIWWSTTPRVCRSPMSAPAPSKPVVVPVCLRWWPSMKRVVVYT